MNKQLLSFSFLLTLFFYTPFAFAQNCGQVLDFTSTIAENGNGTSNYTFYVETKPVSGGTKSVQITISCGGTAYITNQCYEAPAAGTVITIGPFNNQPTCSGTPTLTWTGYTNSKCGGSSCAGTTLALPVEMIYFSVAKGSNGTDLTWATATELNNLGFEVERSADGIEWSSIGWKEGNGTTQNIVEYKFTDNNPLNGKSYYRLKQIDFDGQFEYSEIQKITSQHFGEITLYPNPTKGMVQFSSKVQSYKIFDSYGILLKSVESETKHLDLSEYKHGMYLIESMDENNVKSVNRIILSR